MPTDSRRRLDDRQDFFTAQRLAPLVQEGGAIVFPSSVADSSGEPGVMIYAATEAAVASLASGFAGTPAEVARAVLFVAFEATFTTSTKLPVDGGQKLGAPCGAGVDESPLCAMTAARTAAWAGHRRLGSFLAAWFWGR